MRSDDLTAAATPWARHRIPLALAALALAFFAGHLPFLARVPGDIDSVNFVLGIRHFDVSAHQPHPPGYPLYTALGRAALGITRQTSGTPGTAEAVSNASPVVPEALALSRLSALSGALAIWPLFALFRRLGPSDRVALCASALAVASPLFWFTASRPLSDVTGLAVALAIQLAAVALLFSLRRDSGPTFRGDAGIVGTAAASGLAMGLRLQVGWLTLPLVVLLLAERWRHRQAGRVAAASLAGLAIGVAAWMLVAAVQSGGPSAYAAAFQRIADDELAEDMLMTNPVPARLGRGLAGAFISPWGSPELGWIVIGLAVAGAVVLIGRGGGAAALLAWAFVPYAVLHLLVHDGATLRYALPLVVPVAYLAVLGVDALARRGTWAVVALLSATCLAITQPDLARYSSHGVPAFAALGDMRRELMSAESPGPIIVLQHALAFALRGEALDAPRLDAAPRGEWDALHRYWEDGGTRTAWLFVAPDWSPLFLVDPRARRGTRSYRWAFQPERLMAGTRPGAFDWHVLEPPGWFGLDGWSLTPELAGQRHLRYGADFAGPAVAKVKRRDGPAIVLVGGRHLGGPGDPGAEFTMSIDGRPVARWRVAAGSGAFLERLDLAEGDLSGKGIHARLEITWRADGEQRRGEAVRAAIEQFDLQPPEASVYGFAAGWHEQEYSPSTGRRWRWTTGRAETAVHHGGSDLTLYLRAESPLKYFDEPPVVVVRAGEQELARAEPAGDLTLEVRVPAAALDRSGGRLTIETSRVFVPAERSASPDRRPLGLRVFEFGLRADREAAERPNLIAASIRP